MVARYQLPSSAGLGIIMKIFDWEPPDNLSDRIECTTKKMNEE